jgi:hypothetical protein
MPLDMEELLRRAAAVGPVQITSTSEVEHTSAVVEVVTVQIGDSSSSARGYNARRDALTQAVILAGGDVSETETDDDE